MANCLIVQATIRPRALRSLSVRNFRLWIVAQLVSSTGTWMQTVAQDWLVLQLTGKPFPVGVTTALQFLPTLLLGGLTGVLADRHDKRRLLLATQTAMALLAATLGVAALTGHAQLWLVDSLAFLLGIATAVDMPARQAFAAEMVGPDLVGNAVALNSAAFNTARVLGPAVAGILIARVGTAPAFLMNSASFIAVLAALVAMDPSKLHRGRLAARRRGQLREGMAYVVATPVLRTTLIVVTIVSTFGMNFRVTIPLLARFVFHGGPGTYGLLASALAVGSVAGALASAARARPRPVLLTISALGLTGLGLATAAAPNLTTELVLLPLLGMAAMTLLTTANAMLQVASAPQLRGRVMSLYGVVLLGVTPLGSLLVASLAGQVGVRLTLGLIPLAGISAAIVAHRGYRQPKHLAEDPATTEVDVDPDCDAGEPVTGEVSTGAEAPTLSCTARRHIA